MNKYISTCKLDRRDKASSVQLKAELWCHDNEANHQLSSASFAVSALLIGQLRCLWRGKVSPKTFVCSRVVQLYYKLALRFESIFAEFPMGPTLPPLSRMYCGVPVKPNPVKDLSLTLSQQRTVILLLWAAWWNFPITLQDAIILCP